MEATTCPWHVLDVTAGQGPTQQGTVLLQWYLCSMWWWPYSSCWLCSSVSGNNLIWWRWALSPNIGHRVAKLWAQLCLLFCLMTAFDWTQRPPILKSVQIAKPFFLVLKRLSFAQKTTIFLWFFQDLNVIGKKLLLYLFMDIRKRNFI